MRVLLLSCACILSVVTVNAATIHVPADQPFAQAAEGAPAVEWSCTVGGPDNDKANSVAQTRDGGYIVAGYCDFVSGGDKDIHLLRLNHNGDTVWTKIFGGHLNDEAWSVCETSDLGFVVGGCTESFGSGSSSIYVIKTDSLGDSVWARTYEGVNEDAAYSVCETYDGGLIIAGKIGPLGIGNWDAYLIKTNGSGDTIWTNHYGGDGNEYAYSVQQTNDGGFILTGSNTSPGSDGMDVYLVKCDSSGQKDWEKKHGGYTTDIGRSVRQTLDGGYIIGGSTSSFGEGQYDLYLIKTDSLGDTLWTRTFGGETCDHGYSVQQTIDTGYIIGGYTSSFCTTTCAYLIKTDRYGDSTWSRMLVDSSDGYCYSVQQTSDGGFVMAGSSNGDVYLVKLAGIPPRINYITVDGVASPQNLTNHTPTFLWSYFDQLFNPQDSFEIEVGTDSDWTVAEMWDAPPVATSDTFIAYSGVPLADGTSYFMRVRLRNELYWSNWYVSSFHMNSIPSIPVPLNPINDEYTSTTPTLWVDNSTDAEGDALIYDFLVDVDTLYGEPDPVTGYGIPEGEDSTGWQVTETLDENKRYVWIVRAFDGYEYSDWTGGYEYTFFVNGTPEPPTAPQAQFPPDTGGTPVWDMLTYFYWAPSTDPDPLDTVRYKLEIAVDSTFTFVNTIDSIESVPFTLNDSLTFGTRYWWRVTAFDKTGLSTLSPNTPDFWTWTLGDVDYSHDVSVGDLTYLVAFLFQGGQAIYPLFIGDIDGSCTVDVGDLTYLVAYLFQSGPAPKVGCA